MQYRFELINGFRRMKVLTHIHLKVYNMRRKTGTYLTFDDDEIIFRRRLLKSPKQAASGTHDSKAR